MYYACSDWSIPVGLDQSIQTRKFPAKRFFKNNYCGYFIKELLPNGFPCLDNVIQTLGMLLDFRKAKNTRLVFCYAFLQSRNIPRVWITLSKPGKPLGISLISIIRSLHSLRLDTFLTRLISLLYDSVGKFLYVKIIGRDKSTVDGVISIRTMVGFIKRKSIRRVQVFVAVFLFFLITIVGSAF